MFSWFGKVSFVPYSKVADFAVHLKDGRLMGSLCKKCGYQTFPPRADCPECMSPDFSFQEYSGRGEIYTFTRTTAAPVGFDDIAPYTIIVVELEGGGRLVAWQGESLTEDDVRIGRPVQVVPRVWEKGEEIKVYYTAEQPGTTWNKAPAPHLG
ncbi:MAG: Zn-ribbon domain-containing OB-fold protein [Planctomycetes bacterium]|nr:Zn-ribbon domain-containing OB-fold protein [Planctomycetota bacterium]